MIDVEVELPDDTVTWLLADGSIVTDGENSYRMTGKGVAWFSAWMKERLDG